MVVAVIAALLTLLDAPTVFRVVLGLPLVLFVPGYTVICALFPSTEAIDTVERLTLSVTLSLGIIPLLTLGIEYSPWSLTLTPILASLLLITFTGSVCAIARRTAIPPQSRFKVKVPVLRLSGPGDLGRPTRLLFDIMFVCGLVFLASAITIVSSRLEADPMTEFAVYNNLGESEYYQREIQVGTFSNVILEIRNKENQRESYEVAVFVADQMVNQITNIELNPGEVWREPVDITVQVIERSIPVNFYLFRDGDNELPYRTLRLTVSGEP